MNTIKLSTDYKSNTQKAIFSILLFIIVYLALVGLALGLTGLCIYGGVFIILIRPMLLTVVLGAGISSLGILVLIFLVKFIFKSHKIDRSHLIEVNREQEPKLFEMIDDIVRKVETTRPKKVYLSADVNACVFYDSNFWSMFFPVRKNLQIGIGLVNTLSQEELKAVLAHEFGHFSQRTMKVGSYVYNVNQVIFNMLNDNDSYDELIQSWANVSGYFVPFINGALKIIQGIQVILGKMYNLINLSYMALSRQMEFHADEVAAYVTGSEPLKTALLRLDLAEHSYQRVLDYYGGKISQNIKSENIYKDQFFVLHFIADQSGIPIEKDFPQVTKHELTRFNKSKLVIDNQWASHPSTEERADRLSQLNIPSETSNSSPGFAIFTNPVIVQRKMTDHLFTQVKYENVPVVASSDSFISDFESEFRANSFDRLYNEYYNHRNPASFEVSWIASQKTLTSYQLDDLFSSERIDLVYTLLGIKGDLETLNYLISNPHSLKSFDYDGEKFKIKECFTLIQKLNEEQNKMEEKLKEHDIQIFRFFMAKEREKQNTEKLITLYSSFFSFDKAHENSFELYSKIQKAIQFIQRTTPFDEIRHSLHALSSLEYELKSIIRGILTDQSFKTELTEDIKQSFDVYLTEDLKYFAGEQYNNHNLEIFYKAIDNFYLLISKILFVKKKELLDYQALLA